jgi:hypothetical protein
MEAAPMTDLLTPVACRRADDEEPPVRPSATDAFREGLDHVGVDGGVDMPPEQQEPPFARAYPWSMVGFGGPREQKLRIAPFRDPTAQGLGDGKDPIAAPARATERPGDVRPKRQPGLRFEIVVDDGRDSRPWKHVPEKPVVVREVDHFRRAGEAASGHCGLEVLPNEDRIQVLKRWHHPELMMQEIAGRHEDRPPGTKVDRRTNRRVRGPRTFKEPRAVPGLQQ